MLSVEGKEVESSSPCLLICEFVFLAAVPSSLKEPNDLPSLYLCFPCLSITYILEIELVKKRVVVCVCDNISYGKVSLLNL